MQRALRGSGPSALAPPLVLRDPFDVSWRERVAVVAFAGGVLLAGLIIGLRYAHEATLEMMGLVPASMFVLGKFLPLVPLSGQSHFTPWELGVTIWLIDTYTVLFVVYATEGLYKLHPVKRFLARVQTNAGLVLAAYPAIRRAAVAGVVMFVLFPVAGTGAMAGAFMGILLGLHRLVLIAAVSLGGLTGGMLMAFAAIHFGDGVERLRAAQSTPAIKYTMIAIVLAVVGTGFWLLHRAYRRALTRAQVAPPDPDRRHPGDSADSA